MKQNIGCVVLGMLFSLFLLSPMVFAAGKTHVVEVPAGKSLFVPEVITIAPGDVIKWINHDHKMTDHKFASIPGPKRVDKELKVIVLKPDATYEHTFKEPGEYNYYCYIHRGMIGKIIVK